MHSQAEPRIEIPARLIEAPEVRAASAKGANHTSLGRSPRNRFEKEEGLKARAIIDPDERRNETEPMERAYSP